MIRRLVSRDGQPLATYLCIGGASALTEWSAFWLLLKTPLHYTAAAVAISLTNAQRFCVTLPFPVPGKGTMAR